jgi:cytidine deaminase
MSKQDNILRQADNLAEMRTKYSTFPMMHGCYILNGQNNVSGFNSDRPLYSGSGYTEHAETNALSKLIKIRRKNANRMIVIDLLVIRTDKSLNFKNSKPCYKCIDHMANLPKYGYRIRYVYYSNCDGVIIRKKLSELYDEENKHVSHGFRY